MLKLQVLTMIIFFSLAVNQASAQIQITGTVTDEETHVPIEFANIFLLSDQRIGVITNPNGQFTIPIPDHLLQDTIVISQMGYKTYYQPIQSIRTDQVSIQISLQPNPVILEEAIVMTQEALQKIVRAAIDRIPQNYPRHKHRLKAFYREYSIQDSNYSHLSEAFVTIQDNGYQREDGISVFLHELRKSDDQRKIPLKLQAIRKNELWAYYTGNNLIRNRRFSMWYGDSKNLADIGDFHYLGESQSGPDTIIHIGYYNTLLKDLFSKELYDQTRGELLINTSDYAIIKHRFNYHSIDSFMEIQFQKIEGKYYPTLLLNTFRPNIPRLNLVINRSQAYHIYQVETTKKQFEPLGAYVKIKEDQSLRDMPYNYHPEFWENNTFLMHVPAATALKRDRLRLQTLNEQFRDNAEQSILKRKNQ